MNSPLAEKVFTHPGNTVFIRPPRNGLFQDRISETSLVRRIVATPPVEKALQPISWPDLIQMPPRTLLKILSDARKSATITIDSTPNIGQIYLRKGKICFALVTPSTAPIPAHKAFHRILMWKAGTLKLQWGEPPYQADEICDEVVPLLDENAARTEELCAFENMFPPQTPLKIRKLPETVRNFEPAELDVLQMAMEGKTIQDILDAHPFSDLEIYRTLLSFVRAGLIGSAEDLDAEWLQAC